MRHFQGPIYFPGANEAIAKVDSLDLDGCLAWLDLLFGRDRLRYGDTIAEVKAELIRQIGIDFQVDATFPDTF